MAHSDDADALYGLPLDEFTNARNDLARSLRKEGRREDATAVAALRKPSLPAWVVNQLVRRDRNGVDALLDAAEAIRKGEEGDERFRRAVDGLTRSAREILAAADRAATDTVLQEVATTLRTTAAVAPEELAEGRLTAAREASGFTALAGAAPTRSRKGGGRRKDAGSGKRARPVVDRAAVEAARRALEEAREEARLLRRAADAAERDARRAREAADRAERRVEKRKAALEEARAAGSTPARPG